MKKALLILALVTVAACGGDGAKPLKPHVYAANFEGLTDPFGTNSAITFNGYQVAVRALGHSNMDAQFMDRMGHGNGVEVLTWSDHDQKKITYLPRNLWEPLASTKDSPKIHIKVRRGLDEVECIATIMQPAGHIESIDIKCG